MNNETRPASTSSPPTLPGGQHYHFHLMEIVGDVRGIERSTRNTAETVEAVRPALFARLDAIERSTNDCVTVLKSIRVALIVIGVVALLLLAR